MLADWEDWTGAELRGTRAATLVVIGDQVIQDRWRVIRPEQTLP